MRSGTIYALASAGGPAGLAVVRLRTASLLAPLAAHVVNNAVGVAVLLFA